MLMIKDWDLSDRPREKLQEKGRDALSDAELLAIIIGNGIRGCSALDLAKRILSDCNNDLNILGGLTVEGLCQKHRGIGKAKAITIIAAMELAKRKLSVVRVEKFLVSSSKNAFDLLYPMLSDLPHEEFWIVLLNRANKVIKTTCVSQGGITGTVADVRLIMRLAIEAMATGIILSHNHPSGNCKPSSQDLQITYRIADAAKTFDMTVLDHIIVAEAGYFSFADENLLVNRKPDFLLK